MTATAALQPDAPATQTLSSSHRSLPEHGAITNWEFREPIPDISDETVRRLLADLVDQGLIIKVGERKATYYILK